MTTQEKARLFRDLHHGGRILVLPNAWDAASARIFELAGARAIATTSSGIAQSLGYPDGENIPRDLVVAVVRRITATVDIPVSVDAEAGYGTSAEAVSESVSAFIDAGAVGINLEDAVGDPAVLVAKVRAVRELAARKNVALFVNARTDVYLRRRGEPAAQLADALARLHAYEEAGADGVFVPGAADAETISALVRETRRPLNILAWPGVPEVAELQRLGVARVSVGGGPMRAALTTTRRIAHELLERGSYAGFADAIPHAEVDRMFTREARS